MAKILLIEDDDRLSRLISKGLQDTDFEVSSAYDGMTGMKLATQKDFDRWLPISFCQKTVWISVKK